MLLRGYSQGLKWGRAGFAPLRGRAELASRPFVGRAVVAGAALQHHGSHSAQASYLAITQDDQLRIFAGHNPRAAFVLDHAAVHLCEERARPQTG